MPRAKSDKDSQVTIVLPGAWLDDAQKIAEGRSARGRSHTRPEAFPQTLSALPLRYGAA